VSSAQSVAILLRQIGATPGSNLFLFVIRQMRYRVLHCVLKPKGAHPVCQFGLSKFAWRYYGWGQSEGHC